MFDETRIPVAPIIIVNGLFKIRVSFKLRVFSKVLFTERAPNIAFKPFLNAFVMIGMLTVELSDDILFFILLQTNRTLILLKLWMHFEVGCFQEEPFDSRIVDFCDLSFFFFGGLWFFILTFIRIFEVFRTRNFLIQITLLHAFRSYQLKIKIFTKNLDIRHDFKIFYIFLLKIT